MIDSDLDSLNWKAYVLAFSGNFKEAHFIIDQIIDFTSNPEFKTHFSDSKGVLPNRKKL
jgi:hypothetical protein